jgi:valyl-tRNA synthetase
MMMFGLYAMDQVPFHTVVLTGLIRDQFGRKMSKSKGNTVDPLEWMDAYGTDAVRFTMARGANPGTDVPVGEEWVAGSRNFCNKLWNATRFALLNGATVSGELPRDLAGADAWIVSRLNTVIAEADCSTTSRGTRCATGTSSLPRSPWPGRAPRSRSASSVKCSTRCCGCCTRSCRS